MKKLSIFFNLMLLFSFDAYAASNKKEVPVLLEEPNRSYGLISPISVDKSTIDKAFLGLKKKASQLGADAIIEMECKPGEKIKGPYQGNGLIGLMGRNTTIMAQCRGIAIKWL